jgi:hypothetical protein
LVLILQKGPQLVWTFRRGSTVGLDVSLGLHSLSGHFGEKNLSRCRYRKNKSFSLGSILGRDKIIFSPPTIQYSG